MDCQECNHQEVLADSEKGRMKKGEGITLEGSGLIHIFNKRKSKPGGKGTCNKKSNKP